MALVGNAAAGITPVTIMTAVHTDAQSGHTAYAFVQDGASGHKLVKLGPMP